MGLALYRLERPGEALELLFKGLSISTRVQDFLGASSLHSRIAPILQSLGRNQEALAHFEKALRIHRQLGNKRSVMADLLALSQFYQQVMGDSAKALAYHQEYSALSRELFSEETAANIAGLQTRYEADKKQREIDILQHDMANQEKARNTAIAAALLLILFLGLTYYRYRQAARTTRELRLALQQVKTLQGLLPICANCKKIRDDTGYWHQVESYVTEHSNAEFTHGICPACAQSLYPDFVQTVEQSTAKSGDEASKKHSQ
jgi:tetratricopeptide (TPR) repeat protein